MKTIDNMFNSSRKEIVIDAADAHYDTLCELIETLIDSESLLTILCNFVFLNIKSTFVFNS